MKKAGDNAGKLAPALVDSLDSLCYSCPRGKYTEKCPFQKFAGISWQSRISLFEKMDLAQAAELFDLATDCSCPKDPRTIRGQKPT